MKILLIHPKKCRNSNLNSFLENMAVYQYENADQLKRKIETGKYNLLIVANDVKSDIYNLLIEELKVTVPIITISKVDRLQLTSLLHLIDYVELSSNDFDIKIMNNPIFYESLVYIEENLHKSNLSLDDVASYVFLSSSYYSRVFQKNMGVTYQHYVMNKRIKKAKILLKQGKTVTDVCFLVGYTDLTHFSKTFRKIVGMNPSEFKERAMDQKQIHLGG